MQYSKGAMPNFLAKMAAGSSQDAVAKKMDGIEGALKRKAEHNPEDREDRDDEAPQVVDDAFAVLSKKERRAVDPQERGGSLRFKDTASAAAKFTESADRKIISEQQDERGEDGNSGRDVDSASGRVIFNAGAAAAASSAAARQKGEAGKKKVKKLNNTKLLSFETEDE